MSHGRVTRRGLGVLTLLAAAVASGAPARAQGRSVRVHKDPSCGCCTGWARHMEANGFAVTLVDVADLDAVKSRFGVPDELRTCHTAEVGGYVIEGHVPATAVERLLAERPAATGLAVPGMPIGSPGMEGGAPETYQVILFGPGVRRGYGRFHGASAV
ncbi:DUF411 domain-containing protein [Rhodoplanes sp. SY1]|uniref:DUF411 domain-containing protein n=1 Tax=Rhodoplanes sp. SY1 TaxID=3166646 RepID=UPI0038B6035D